MSVAITFMVRNIEMLTRSDFGGVDSISAGIGNASSGAKQAQTRTRLIGHVEPSNGVDSNVAKGR